MKRTKTILTALVIILVSSSSTFAQSFDSNRMSRDIKILESVLGEFFKTGNLRTNGSEFFFSNSRSTNVRGTYLPDYGVIFLVPSGFSNNMIVIDGEEKTYEFYYGGDSDKDSEINEGNITSRIKEFLRDYAATIGQLEDDENVMVIYGANSNQRNRFNLLEFSGQRMRTREKEGKKLPVISVVATKKQIDDHRSGKLSEDAFNNAIKVAKNVQKEYLDLKVLGNIFETALQEDEDNNFHLTSSGSLGYLYMENFGAFYTINVHRGHKRNNSWSTAYTIDSKGTIITGSNSEDLKRSLEELRQEQADREEEVAKETAAEYDELLTKMREFIVDYGRTLSSVKENQFILVTVNITDRLKDIPDRVDFQIKKSDLTALDKGNINRETALNRVSITEY